FIKSDCIIMMPDYNGFQVFSKLLPFLRGKGKCKLVYLVIGGWLSEFLESHKQFIPPLNKFDAILCETNCLNDELDCLGVKNLYVVPNFKRLNILNEFPDRNKDRFEFCYFARVMEEKGIEDAVQAIKIVSEKYGKDKISLDIYGSVESVYEERFEELKKAFPKNIKYKGISEYDKTVDTLKDYFMLLFPTKYYAECQPGSIIDAYAAGIPVIAYDWKGGCDIVTDSVDGYLIEIGVDNLVRLIENAIENPDKIDEMKKQCVIKAQKFTPETNVKMIVEIINSI
ncbi:MAG: glycosyltransferase family 4 protein, partial [Clostridia bacterium]|nr:glycosyltransferase family 4 protein [Clostridia bacterium]